jgi:hypothetical protein
MSAFLPAQFDESAWPLLVVQFPALMNNTVAIRSIIDGFEGLYRRNVLFATVFDGSGVTKFPGALERKTLVDWMGNETRVATERRLSVATGLVLPSGTMRAFMSALNWVNRPVTPQKITATRQEAIDWCCERLREAGVAVPWVKGASGAQR